MSGRPGLAVDVAASADRGSPPFLEPYSQPAASPKALTSRFLLPQSTVHDSAEFVDEEAALAGDGVDVSAFDHSASAGAPSREESAAAAAALATAIARKDPL